MSKLITNKEKLALNSELKKEVKTLGHCLSVIEKSSTMGDAAEKVKSAAKQARDAAQYELLKANVTPSKNGNYSVWAVLGYLINAYKA
jgi:hypothetical protein